MATKVAFILPVNGLSGGMYVVYMHAHHLASRGYEVEILFSSTSHGTDVRCFPGFSLPAVSLAQAKVERRVYDLLLATSWGTFYDLFGLSASRLGYFVQSDERQFYAGPKDPRVAWVDFTYRYPGVAYVTEARWIQRMLADEFGQEAEYAPNGVDTRVFRPDGATEAPRDAGRVRLLLEGPGRTPYKRIGLSFRVAERVRARSPNMEIWYVSGDGYVDPRWRADRVFKRLSWEEMARVYRSCDLLLKLSTVEGFFGPPLEMMACGGTAVVSRVNGWDEYVQDGENALAVAMDDEEAAVAALSRLVSDAGLRGRLARQGLATARALDWSARFPLFEQAILKMMRGPGESRAGILDKVRLTAFRGAREFKRRLAALRAGV